MGSFYVFKSLLSWEICVFPTGAPDVRGRGGKREKQDKRVLRTHLHSQTVATLPGRRAGKAPEVSDGGMPRRRRGPPSRGGAARAVFDEVTLETA